MATSSKQTVQLDKSVVMDMEVMDDMSDYEEDNFSGRPPQNPDPQPSAGASFEENMKQKVSEGVASYMWETSRQQAKKALSVYGNLDMLRPYFDVQPHEVKTRLLQSLIPSINKNQENLKVHRELYGPLMVVLTLIALLLFEMKSLGHVVQEGTLMGTAFGMCYGYWFGVSSIVWTMAYVCNTRITMLQILSLLGYALFGHCIVILLGTVIHTSHDHLFFYLLLVIFGGLSTARMVSILTARTPGWRQKLFIGITVASIHLLFLIYLHFAYHKIVEDIDQVLTGNQPQPIVQAVPELGVKESSVADLTKIPGQSQQADDGNGVNNVAGSVRSDFVVQSLKRNMSAVVDRSLRGMRRRAGGAVLNETIAQLPAVNA